MTDRRVSMFVSHKVASYGRAAGQIKSILEARTERLDVYLCEETPAGDRWREWIRQHIAHSHILLVLLPPPQSDLRWIATEIAQFEAACPSGRVVVLKRPSDPIPDIVDEREIVDATKEKLRTCFLRPLYHDAEFIKLHLPLNSRVTDTHLDDDAEVIANEILGGAVTHSKFYGESLVVETIGLDVATSLGDAPVLAPNGCVRILNWDRQSFPWRDLRSRAIEERGKGTFWVTEMEQIIAQVARQTPAPVMTSTFRGRGAEAGQIFRPQLDRVDFCNGTPARYYFVFHEVLEPELARGPEQIGEAFNLLYILTRVRWEVLNPFLVNMFLAGDMPSSQLPTSHEQRQEIIGKVIGSLRVIERQVERYNMRERALSAFDDNEQDLAIQMLERRESLKSAIEAAANRGDFKELMGELTERLEFNCGATELLASKFLELVRKDREKVQQMLERTRPK